MTGPVYRRVVIKLSGEYLAGSQGVGIDQPTSTVSLGDLIAAQSSVQKWQSSSAAATDPRR